jgi:hypothetical protein
MAELVDKCIWEAAKATIGLEFKRNFAAMAKLELPARFKGGGIMSKVEMRNPSFMGAQLDALPKMMDITTTKGR